MLQKVTRSREKTVCRRAIAAAQPCTDRQKKQRNRGEPCADAHSIVCKPGSLRAAAHRSGKKPCQPSPAPTQPLRRHAPRADPAARRHAPRADPPPLCRRGKFLLLTRAVQIVKIKQTKRRFFVLESTAAKMEICIFPPCPSAPPIFAARLRAERTAADISER